MEAMDRVTFVQGVFCGVLLTILGAAVFGPSRHGAAATHSTSSPPSHPTVDERHPEVVPQRAVVAPQTAINTPPHEHQLAEPTRGHAELESRTYDLAWSDYDGTGDVKRAKFSLDGKTLGVGEAGLDALRDAIAHLPSGSTVRVRTYYSAEPAGDVRKQYPFDVAKLQKLAEDHHVTFALPAAG